jgi:uncharacterized protein
LNRLGLASYLLGLEKEIHVSRDPLRGNLFENMVVIEALKYRFNCGKRNNLHFYRDAKGNEVDLLVDIGPHVFPLEIKAGATISEDYFKGLRSFAGNGAPLPLGTGLVYGGDEIELRSGIRIYPATGIHELLESLEG